MNWIDFAHWANANWKGCFTEKEIIDNAEIYKAEARFTRETKQMSDVIDTLIENLEEDVSNGNEEAELWLSRIKEELI